MYVCLYDIFSVEHLLKGAIYISYYYYYYKQPGWLAHAHLRQPAGQTQLTHHSTSGGFPEPLSLLGLPIEALSSPLSGQQQPAGALGLHLSQTPKQRINLLKQHPPHTPRNAWIKKGHADADMQFCSACCARVLDTRCYRKHFCFAYGHRL